MVRARAHAASGALRARYFRSFVPLKTAKGNRSPRFRRVPSESRSTPRCLSSFQLERDDDEISRGLCYIFIKFSFHFPAG